MEEYSVFSAREEKVRRNWLIYFIITCIWTCYTLISSNALFLSKDAKPIDPIPIIAAVFAGACLSFYFIYHKRGTILLRIALFFAPFALIRAFTNLAILPINALTITVSCMGAALTVWGFIANFNLLQVNKIAKMQRKLAKALIKLNKASSLQKLDARFTKFVARFPAKEVELANVYQQRKTELQIGLDIHKTIT